MTNTTKQMKNQNPNNRIIESRSGPSAVPVSIHLKSSPRSAAGDKQQQQNTSRAATTISCDHINKQEKRSTCSCKKNKRRTRRTATTASSTSSPSVATSTAEQSAVLPISSESNENFDAYSCDDEEEEFHLLLGKNHSTYIIDKCLLNNPLDAVLTIIGSVFDKIANTTRSDRVEKRNRRVVKIDVDQVIMKCCAECPHDHRLSLPRRVEDMEKLRKEKESIPALMRVSRTMNHYTRFDSIRSMEAFNA